VYLQALNKLITIEKHYLTEEKLYFTLVSRLSNCT